MARMPLGQPRSVPDPHGEAVDEMLAELRARRQAEDAGLSPLPAVTRALHDFQAGPKIARPNALQSMIPVVGPAWEAAGELQDGHYGKAALDAGAAILDLTAAGEAVKGARALSKGVGLLNKGSKTAESSRKVLRRAGLAKPGEEIHHVIPLDGLGRSIPDWRNHFVFLKRLPKEQHRRLTGSWNGKPRYDPIRRAWYGTAGWMKALPASMSGHVAASADQQQDP